MKCVVCFNQCDDEYFRQLSNWSVSLSCDFLGICCDEHSDLNIVVDETKKKEIESKVSKSNLMIVLAGKHCYDAYPCGSKFRNWMAFAISRNSDLEKKLIIVKLKPSNPVPMEAYGIGAEWVHEFSEESICLGFQRLWDNNCGFSDWKKQRGR